MAETPCDINNHVMCCHECDCACHEDHVGDFINAVVAYESGRLDAELLEFAREVGA